MLSRYFIITCFIFALSVTLKGQTSDPVHEFNMDQCDLLDSRGSGDGLVFGPNPCGCGANINGLAFDGNITFAEFDRNVNDVLMNDWTMTFYIQIQNTDPEPVDILFLGEECSIDSILSLRYLPSSGRFRFNISDVPGNDVVLNADEDDNSCWQYVAIVKSGALVSIYINGRLADVNGAPSDIALNVNSVLTIGNSPCQQRLDDVPFRGTIDEFLIYDRPLTEREILNADLKPDKILTRDTTIFEGASIQLQTGGTCFSNFEWTPDADLSNSTTLEPVASPSETSTYRLTVDGDNCQSIDEVTIRIADPSELTCEDLVLPAAFTPNNDGINEVYRISNFFLVERLISFEIFNKWGGRVFFTADINSGWDGIYKGSPAPATSYLYKVAYVCDGSQQITTGSVHLIR